MKPAYEYLGLVPQSELTREIMECSLENALANSTDRGEKGSKDARDSRPSNVNALLSAGATTAGNGSELYIGTAEIKGPDKPFKFLQSEILKDIVKIEQEIKPLPEKLQIPELDKDRVLEEIYQQIGSKQVKKKEVEFATAWIVEQAFEKEYNDNWADASR